MSGVVDPGAGGSCSAACSLPTLRQRQRSPPPLPTALEKSRQRQPLWFLARQYCTAQQLQSHLQQRQGRARRQQQRRRRWRGPTSGRSRRRWAPRWRLQAWVSLRWCWLPPAPPWAASHAPLRPRRRPRCPPLLCRPPCPPQRLPPVPPCCGPICQAAPPAVSLWCRLSGSVARTMAPAASAAAATAGRCSSACGQW